MSINLVLILVLESQEHHMCLPPEHQDKININDNNVHPFRGGEWLNVMPHWMQLMRVQRL